MEENKALIGPIDLLNHSWETTKKLFWKVLAVSYLPFLLYLAILVPIILIAVLLGVALGGVGVLIVIVLGFVGLLAMIYFSLWQGVAIIKTLMSEDQNLGLREIAKQSRPMIGAYFSTGVIAGLVVLGGLVPFLFPVYLLGLLVSFWSFVVVDQGVSGLVAVRISREYFRGRFWAVLGRMAFIILVFIGVAILQGLFSAILGQTVGSLLSLVNIPLNVFALAYQYNIYKQLKLTRGPIAATEVEQNKGKWIGLMVWGVVSIFLLIVLIVVATFRIGTMNNSLNKNYVVNDMVEPVDLDI